MKMLVSDFDGTFYKDDESLYKNIEAIKKFRDSNNYFVFATGRSYTDFKSVKDKYNLEYDYLILNHGATIMDKDNNILKINYIDKNVTKDIWNNLNIDNSISNFCCSKNDDRAKIEDDDLIKINVKYIDKNVLNKIQNKINEYYGNFVNAYLASERTLEVVSKNSSKLNAINFLKNHLDINNIYTIGNGESDIEMIENFNGFAIKNGISELNKYNKYDNVYLLVEDIMKD